MTNPRKIESACGFAENALAASCQLRQSTRLGSGCTAHNGEICPASGHRVYRKQPLRGAGEGNPTINPQS